MTWGRNGGPLLASLFRGPGQHEAAAGGFIAEPDAANALAQHLDEIIAENPFSSYDWDTHRLHLSAFPDARKKAGMERFLQVIQEAFGAGYRSPGMAV